MPGSPVVPRDVVTIALGMKGQPQVGVWPRVGAALINKAIRAAMLKDVERIMKLEMRGRRN